MRPMRLRLLLAGLGLLLSARVACPQQATIGTPFHSVHDSFYENIGTSWGFRGKGWGFNFGGGGYANPQFGHYTPGAGLNGGFGLLGGLGNGYFNFTAAQGSQRSFVSQTPKVTMMNGGTGYFADQSISPFVISTIPVVGGAPMVVGMQSMLPPQMYEWNNPSVAPPQNHRVAALKELMQQRQPVSGHQENPANVVGELNAGMASAKAMEPKHAVSAPVAVRDEAPGGRAIGGDSSAGVAVPSVAEAKRLHAAEQKLDDPEMKAQFVRGQAAEENGKPKLAIVYYEIVARRATGELQQQAMERLQQLRTAK